MTVPTSADLLSYRPSVNALRDRVILVGVTTGSVDDAEESMAELEELATSADVLVLDKLIQRRPQIDPKTVLGRGKLEDLE